MNNLVLFGIQVSGKGTQANMLCEEFGYVPFVTGDELRKMAASSSELGQMVKSYIDAGNLVPLEIVMQVVKAAIESHPVHERILFDGIPRDEDQMNMFNTVMEQVGRKFTCVHITLDRDAAFQRILGRAKEEGRADDADEAVINKRMDTFEQKTMPVIEYYKNQGNMIEVDGSGSPKDVYKKMTGIILSGS